MSDSPFPDLPPEIAERVAAVRSASDEARKTIGKSAAGIQHVGPATFDSDEISQAEHRVLELVCEGFSNEEIADQVFLSRETVKTHVRRMLDRCGCRNRSQLAYRWGRGDFSVVLVSGVTKVTLVEKTTRDP